VSWLQVIPSTVPVGCGQSQPTPVVLLVNSGPQTVDWRVAFSVPAEQAEVAVDPQQGELDAGARMLVQLQHMIQLTARQGSSGPQGVVDFAPTTPKAGPPASLTFTTVGCQ
jgi:hypothetical protein